MKIRVIEQNQSPSQTLTLYLSGEQTILKEEAPVVATLDALRCLWIYLNSVEVISSQPSNKQNKTTKKKTADLWSGTLMEQK